MFKRDDFSSLPFGTKRFDTGRNMYHSQSIMIILLFPLLKNQSSLQSQIKTQTAH